MTFRLLPALLLCGALGSVALGADPAPEMSPLDRAVEQMCGKPVALIGESSVHGFGQTLDFKVELVRRLVDRCHYNAVFFESGLYDFLNLQARAKSRAEVTDGMVAAAIGGLWANREVQALIPYLREKLATGAVYLGGIDDQLGRGTWAQSDMPSVLASALDADERGHCVDVLRKHTQWLYAADAPYGPRDKERLLGCLNHIGARLRDRASPARDRERAMVDSLERLLGRDFADVPAGSDERTFGANERDRSMYLNFHWLLSQLPPRAKVLVWTATVHAAKQLSAVPGYERRIPFGSFVRRDFGDSAFGLGFSALSGTYAMTGQPAQSLSPAPDESLESRSLTARADDVVYRSGTELRTAGAVPARALSPTFTTAQWDAVIDALVIFRQERPPDYIKR